MSKISDKFLSDFSEQEEKHNKTLKENEEKRKKADDEKNRFNTDFEKIFRKEIKPKLDELKSSLISKDLFLDYTSIKRTQSDAISFEINLSKKSYPSIKIVVSANSTFKRIDFNQSSASATYEAKKKQDFNLLWQDFSIDEFEKIIFEILRFYYLSE